LLHETNNHQDERQGIQSVEVGFRLLDVLANANRSMMLRDIAKGAGMPAAKAHRYMVSFVRIGLVEQESSSGRYDLGQYALKLGVSSLGRLDHVRLAGPIIDDLCEQIDETVALAVLGTHGATVVRISDPGGPVTVSLRAGTVLPLLSSATGRAFASFHRSPFIKEKLQEELRKEHLKTMQPFVELETQAEDLFTEFRQRGLSRATGSLTPGINGFSAPVFDHSENMVAAITSLGPVGDFNVEWNSPLAQTILVSANKLSRRLGLG